MAKNNLLLAPQLQTCAQSFLAAVRACTSAMFSSGRSACP